MSVWDYFAAGFIVGEFSVCLVIAYFRCRA